MGLEALARMEYPGQFIIVGKDPTGTKDAIIYGITAKSPEERAQCLYRTDSGIMVIPSGDAGVGKRTPPFIYPAIAFSNNRVIAGNGWQTLALADAWNETNLATSLFMTTLDKYSYQRDEPHYTPRIQAVVGKEIILSIIQRFQESARGTLPKHLAWKCMDGSTVPTIHFLHELSPEPGQGYLLATYAGKNEEPHPSFAGHPQEVTIDHTDVTELCQDVFFGALLHNPFTVGVAAVLRRHETGELLVRIYNTASSGEKAR